MSWYNPGTWSYKGDTVADAAREGVKVTEKVGQQIGHGLAKVAPEVLGTAGMIFGGPALAGLGAGVGTVLDRKYNDKDSWKNALVTGGKAGVGTDLALTGVGMGLNALEGATGSAGLDFTAGGGAGSTLANLGTKALGVGGSLLSGGTDALSGLLGGKGVNDLLAMGLPIAAVEYLTSKAKPNTVTGMKEEQAAGADVAKAAGQAGTLATAATDAYTSGKLQPYQQQAVTNFQQKMSADVKQKFANLGLSGSTMEITEDQNIQNQVAALSSSYQAINFQNAITALTTQGTLDNQSAQIYSTLAQQNIEQNKDYQDAISEAAKVGASLFASMSKGGSGSDGGGGILSGLGGLVSGAGSALKSGYDWLTGGSSGGESVSYGFGSDAVGTVGSAGEGATMWEDLSGLL